MARAQVPCTPARIPCGNHAVHAWPWIGEHFSWSTVDRSRKSTKNQGSTRRFRWTDPNLHGSKRFWGLMWNPGVSKVGLDKCKSILSSDTNINDRSCEKDFFLSQYKDCSGIWLPRSFWLSIDLLLFFRYEQKIRMVLHKITNRTLCIFHSKHILIHSNHF